MPVKRNFDLTEDHQRGMQAVLQEMELIGLLIVKDAVGYLDDNKINAEGDLKKSINERVELFMGGVAARLTVGAGAKHAIFVHDGRKPGKVPYDKKAKAFTFLHRWVEKKLNIVDKAEIKSVAAAVAQKIAKEGTEAKPFLDFAITKHQDKFADRLQKAYLRGFDA